MRGTRRGGCCRCCAWPTWQRSPPTGGTRRGGVSELAPWVLGRHRGGRDHAGGAGAQPAPAGGGDRHRDDRPALAARARPAAADAAPPAADRWWQAAGYGASAGFATTVANAAGPVMNLYLLARRLPKHEFVATGAWFFFAVNLSSSPSTRVTGSSIGARSLSTWRWFRRCWWARSWDARCWRACPQAAFDKLVMALTVGAGGAVCWYRADCALPVQVTQQSERLEACPIAPGHFEG